MQAVQFENKAKIETGRAFSLGGLAINLRQESFPSPILRKPLENTALGEKAVLPQIIALQHDDEGFLKAQELIKKLPKGSRVVLEGDDMQEHKTEVQNFYAKNGKSFTGLALLAKRCGHIPIRMERHTALYRAEDRKIIKRIGQLVEISQRLKRGSPQWLTVVHERLQLLNIRQIDPKHKSPPFTSAWRSEMMARKIASIKDWKATDVIITGSAHALNLAKIFNVEVSYFIGKYRSEQEIKSTLGNVMLGQCELQQKLNGLRQIKKIAFALRHPINFWRGYISKSGSELKHKENI